MITLFLKNMEEILGYKVERKKIKNINLRVDKDLNVYISAPLTLDSYYIENFIKSKKDWIDKNIKRFGNIKEEYGQENLKEGSIIRYYGKKYILKIEKTSYNKIVINDKYIIMKIIDDNENLKKKILDEWYYEKASKIIKELFYKNLEIMNESVEKFKINKIKGKWGYCIPLKREICLNVDLIKRSKFEIEYVIIHEIVHLKIPNHSKMFYQNVETYMKDYKLAEKMLKGYVF